MLHIRLLNVNFRYQTRLFNVGRLRTDLLFRKLCSNEKDQSKTSLITISDLSKKYDLSKQVLLTGWIQSIRQHKSCVFVDVSDGTSPRHLQVVMTPSMFKDQFGIGDGISIKGTVRPIKTRTGQTNYLPCSVELHAQSFALFPNKMNKFGDQHRSEEDQEKDNNDLVTSKLSHHGPRPNLGLMRSSVNALAMRHRLSEFGAMIRIRSKIKSIFHKVMQSFNYLEVDTPIMTTVDCEGSGEMFEVQNAACNKQTQKANSSHQIFLTGTAQLHLEALALGLAKVYTINPVFRAENSHTRHHLAEFHMLEAESILLDSVDSLCSEIESIVRLLFTECANLFKAHDQQNGLTDHQHELIQIHSLLQNPNLNEKCKQSNQFSTEQIKMLLDKIYYILDKPFVRITYAEALHYLNKTHGLNDGSIRDFSKPEERELLKRFGDERKALFITHYPTNLKPFYCRSTDEQYAECTDLLIPGVGELVGASVRETDPDRMRSRLAAQGKQVDSLNWYLNLSYQGNVPHSGFGLGFERFLQFVLGIYNIKDTVIYPRTSDKIIL